MSDGDNEVEALLEGLSPRPEPPADVRARVLAAVEHEWRQHKRRRWHLPLALAATALMAVAVAFMVTNPSNGTIVRISETGGLWVDGVLHRQVGSELILTSGVVLEADGDTRLTSATDADLRLREGSRIVWRSAEEMSLERGTLYVATGGHGRLSVHTPLGVVRDIGTTFMVTVDDGAMEVAMREGAASIRTDHGTYTARARDRRGDVVMVSPGRVVSHAEAISAGRWEWIHSVHPGYRAREVLALLEDIARDLGLDLEFAGPAVHAAALQGQLEGDFDLSGLGPHQALEVVLAGSGFARASGPEDSLIVEFQSDGD